MDCRGAFFLCLCFMTSQSETMGKRVMLNWGAILAWAPGCDMKGGSLEPRELERGHRGRLGQQQD